MPALIAEIDRHGLEAALIIVELTSSSSSPRSSSSATPHAPRSVSTSWRDTGVDVSIDDNGTGYSGLTWLQTLPVTELKLARPFVSLILSDERTRQIVESTVQLANRLGLRVVAEGVEDEATAEGYLISRPLMAGTLDAWRKARSLDEISDSAGRIEHQVP